MSIYVEDLHTKVQIPRLETEKLSENFVRNPNLPGGAVQLPVSSHPLALIRSDFTRAGANS